MEKRIVIVTDSLGLLVHEKQKNFQKLWTDRIINEYRKVHQVLFFPKRGRDTTEILSGGWKEDLLISPKPDILILQVGITDACRRMLPKKVMIAFSMIPGVRNFVKIISQKFHYKLTKLYEHRYVMPKRFKKNVAEIVNGARKHNPAVEIAMIQIAPPGEGLKKKIYNVEEDIKLYNEILVELSVNLNYTVLKPYGEIGDEEILLEDGHHLTYHGHDLVYKTVKEFLGERTLA